jgi:hypothetical protein
MRNSFLCLSCRDAGRQQIGDGAGAGDGNELLVAPTSGELLAPIRKLAPVQRRKLYRRAPWRLA